MACLQREVSAREAHGGEGRIRAARFPVHKSLQLSGVDLIGSLFVQVDTLRTRLWRGYHSQAGCGAFRPYVSGHENLPNWRRWKSQMSSPGQPCVA